MKIQNFQNELMKLTTLFFQECIKYENISITDINIYFDNGYFVLRVEADEYIFRQEFNFDDNKIIPLYFEVIE